jgi:peptidoglycan/xylan/chitin deacetylase (PgdA/CDA1 family)
MKLCKYLLLISCVGVTFISCSGKEEVMVESEVEEVEVQLVSEVPILMYHYVREVDWDSDPLGWRLSINPDDFEKQLSYLRDEGYKSVHLSELLDGEVEENSIVLSFDDGLEDFYTNALPLLSEYGFTASNAVVTGMVGDHEHMSEEQIKECINAGIEIISHTVSHPDLRNLSEGELIAEIVDSKKYLEETFELDVKSFVYPAGKFDDSTLAVLNESGYGLALTTDFGVADLSEDLLLLPRIRIDNRDGFEGFVEKMEGMKVSDF